MQHDLFQSGHDLDLRSNFQSDILKSNYNSFIVYRQEKHDAGKMNRAFLNQKLVSKKHFS